MRTVMLTSKRQATFPAALCEELGVGPGDRLVLERRVVAGKPEWVLRGKLIDWSWFAGAQAHGRRRSHRWSDVRRSIARGWANDHRS